MVKEIGSEFWISDLNTSNIDNGPYWLNSWGNNILTSSGRGAISLLLQEVQPKCKTALLPAYICESVIVPFISHGYTCYFYDVNEDLEASIDNLNRYSGIGIFLHMGYFGFPTNGLLLHTIGRLKEESSIIVEDITHTLFSDYKRDASNDYYFASIRKWMGIPSGGVLASPDRSFKSILPNNNIFSDIRKEALCLKARYISSSDETLKSHFLKLFTEAERLLDGDISSYNIDDISKSIINNIDISRLKEKRRENYNFLLEGLEELEFIEPVFKKLPGTVCPLFYPVYIRKERIRIREYLTDNKIYCPIHWPIPKQIDCNNYKSAANIYNSILSLPCDQRYGLDDMYRIVSVLKRYK